ncbi:uncharacterized protein BJ171DRAFT_519378 [Polychytrium aggregatum]|uniref:uncharacterized protein n=1 Tax=Polychytrium aggregatum TaxID=110093 RepID=UPI0022FDC6D5|nr:uncharacterized protein BJ171DRAFT_519378 [Polychytrium aggregatum]KAI9199285.1 hypothetical protein BJ171DRAFT_519378 [Polychytrium aggregatum]
MFQDIDITTSVIVQYVALGIAGVNHIYNMYFIALRVTAAAGRTVFNWAILFVVWVTQTLFIVLESYNVESQMQSLNGDSDPDLTQKINNISRIYNAMLGISVGVSTFVIHSRLRNIRHILGYATILDYIFYVVWAAVLVAFMASTQFPLLYSWRPAFQALLSLIYAGSVFALTFGILVRLDKLLAALSPPKLIGELPFNDDVKPQQTESKCDSQYLTKAEISLLAHRLLYAQIVLWVVFTAIFISSLAVIKIYVNLGMALQRSAILSVLALETMVLLLVYKVLPRKVNMV